MLLIYRYLFDIFPLVGKRGSSPGLVAGSLATGILQAKLKRLLANAMLDNVALKDLLSKIW